MGEQANITTVTEIYGLFGQGDVAGIVARLSDDVRWLSHLDAVVPWAGDFSGKARVPDFFRAIFDSCDVQAFEPQEWTAQGDTVVSTGRFVCRARTTGRSADTRWCFIWKLKDGAITSYEQFHDPAITAAFA